MVLRRPTVHPSLFAGLMVMAAVAVVAGVSVMTFSSPWRLGVARSPEARTDEAGRHLYQGAAPTERHAAVQRAVAAPGLSTAESVPFGRDGLGPGWGQRIVRQASIDLELADVGQGVARLVALAESLGGFVASTETQTDARGAARATLVVRVPAAEFARALSGIDGVGRVTRQAVGGQDVSEEFVDLEARRRNLERHEAQLLGFVGKAQKVADLVALENELARVRGEIEQAAGRLRFLRNRTELATVQLTLVRAPLGSPRDGPFARVAERLREAFAEGWLTALGWTVALAALAAQLSPLAVPALAGWAIYRRRTGRRPSPPAPGASA
jgi:hypothetical protein